MNQVLSETETGDLLETFETEGWDGLYSRVRALDLVRVFRLVLQKIWISSQMLAGFPFFRRHISEWLLAFICG